MAKSWIYNDLSVKDALYLYINGTKFRVAQFSMTFAKNEIPQAQCMLAIGRHATGFFNGLPPGDIVGFGPSAGETAAVHQKLEDIQRMQDAVVYFTPRGSYNNQGTQWPDGEVEIFRGVISGVAQRKQGGKIHVVVSLAHFLIKLAWSSCLTRSGHVANPSQLNVAAVNQTLPIAGSAGSRAILSSLLLGAISRSTISTDLWFSLKRIFLTLAGMVLAPATAIQTACGLNNEFSDNSPALYALNRIEPLGTTATMVSVPVGGPNLGYTYGRPLSTDNPPLPSILHDVMSAAIGNEFLEAMSGTTFWDKLVAGLCPMFGLAIVPMVDRALVIADVPAARSVWQHIGTDEYDSFDSTMNLDLPLRAVGVRIDWESVTGAARSYGSLGNISEPILGGCFTVGNLLGSRPVGSVLVVDPPGWLRSIGVYGAPATSTSGQLSQRPVASATTPRIPGYAGAGTLDTGVSDLYARYARHIYITNTLRGRNWTIGGKLRFDIAPCSNLEIATDGELFIPEDAMATTLYGQVARVTVQINAEAASAGTAFQLTHLRTPAENREDHTSTDEHQLFTAGNLHGLPAASSSLLPRRPGSPLIPRYDL